MTSKPVLIFFLVFLLTAFCSYVAAYSIWENPERFFELRDDGSCRIILKPYYGFLYEEFPDYKYSGGDISGSEYVELGLKFPGEKQIINIPCMITSGGLFLEIKKKNEAFNPGFNVNGEYSLQGLYIPCGNRSGLLLSEPPVLDEVYAWFFYEDVYFRVRYWITDRPNSPDLRSSITYDGKEIFFPRTLEISGVIYTCVTINETEVRHYEAGKWELLYGEEGNKNIRLKPEKVTGKYVKEHPAKSPYKEDYILPVFFSSDGVYLSLGEPYLVPAEIKSSGEMDGVIKDHNSQRRPPRKPLLEPLELDFHWDEVDRLRR